MLYSRLALLPNDLVSCYEMDHAFRQALEHGTEHCWIERHSQRFQFGEWIPLKH